jgi:hypothetical protein
MPLMGALTGLKIIENYSNAAGEGKDASDAKGSAVARTQSNALSNGIEQRKASEVVAVLTKNPDHNTKSVEIVVNREISPKHSNPDNASKLSPLKSVVGTSECKVWRLEGKSVRVFKSPGIGVGLLIDEAMQKAVMADCVVKELVDPRPVVLGWDAGEAKDMSRQVKGTDGLSTEARELQRKQAEKKEEKAKKAVEEKRLIDKREELLNKKRTSKAFTCGVCNKTCISEQGRERHKCVVIENVKQDSRARFEKGVSHAILSGVSSMV